MHIIIHFYSRAWTFSQLVTLSHWCAHLGFPSQVLSSYKFKSLYFAIVSHLQLQPSRPTRKVSGIFLSKLKYLELTKYAVIATLIQIYQRYALGTDQPCNQINRASVALSVQLSMRRIPWTKRSYSLVSLTLTIWRFLVPSMDSRFILTNTGHSWTFLLQYWRISV